MDVLNGLRLGEDQQVVVAAHVTVKILEPLTTERRFIELKPLDHRAHCAVEHENALPGEGATYSGSLRANVLIEHGDLDEARVLLGGAGYPEDGSERALLWLVAWARLHLGSKPEEALRATDDIADRLGGRYNPTYFPWRPLGAQVERATVGQGQSALVATAMAACIAAPLLVALSAPAALRFAAVLALMCLAPGDCSAERDLWEKPIEQVRRQLRATYLEIDAAFPGTPVVVIPYPDPIKLDGDCGQLAASSPTTISEPVGEMIRLSAFRF